MTRYIVTDRHDSGMWRTGDIVSLSPGGERDSMPLATNVWPVPDPFPRISVTRPDMTAYLYRAWLDPYTEETEVPSTPSGLVEGRHYRVTEVGAEWMSRYGFTAGQEVIAVNAGSVTGDLTWTPATRMFSVTGPERAIGSGVGQHIIVALGHEVEEMPTSAPYGGLVVGDRVRILDREGTCFRVGEQGRVERLGGWGGTARTHVLVNVNGTSQSIRTEYVTKINEETPVTTTAAPAVIAAGVNARITAQNTQTNLAIGTIVRVCRKHRTDNVWLVSTDLTEGADAPRPSGRSTGRTRWAMPEILEPVAETGATTPAPAPAPGLAVGQRVRIVRDSMSHRFAIGSEVVLTEDRTSDTWRATTNLAWRVGDVQPSQTNRWEPGFITDGSRVVSTRDIEPIVTPTPAPAVEPAPGVRVRVTGDNSRHGWATGTEVVLVRLISTFWLATTDLTWTPATAGTLRNSNARGGAVRDIAVRDFEVLNPQPSATPQATVDAADTDALRAERDAAVAALAALRTKIRSVASTEAIKRGWCSEIDEVLAEIEPGLTRLETKTVVTRTFTVTYEVEGILDDGCSRDNPAITLVANDLVDSCFHDKVNITSTSWGEPEMEQRVDDPATTGGAPLTGPGPYSTSARFRVLANPARFNGERHGTLREGMIVTLGNEGRVDSDGEVFVMEYGYVRASSLTAA